MLVKAVMNRPVTAKDTISVRDAARIMSRKGIGSLIITKDKKIVGIITERDVMRKLLEPFFDLGLVKAKDIMSTKLVTISGDVGVEEATSLMVKKKIKKLPVVEDERLVGIVTSVDVMRANPKIIEVFEEHLRTQHGS